MVFTWILLMPLNFMSNKANTSSSFIDTLKNSISGGDLSGITQLFNGKAYYTGINLLRVAVTDCDRIACYPVRIGWILTKSGFQMHQSWINFMCLLINFGCMEL